MYSPVLGTFKEFQITYSSFIHPLYKTVPLEYICETTNGVVSKFTFRIERISSMVNGHTNLSIDEFLKEIVLKNSQHDSITHQLGFIESIERLYDISDLISPMNNRLKMVLSEFERIQEHLTWFEELSTQMMLPFDNECQHLKNQLTKILGYFFNVKTNDLSPVIAVGIVELNWDKEKNDHLQFVLSTYIKKVSYLRDKLLTSFKLKNYLFAVGIMDTSIALKTGTVGPIARASAIEQDLRIDDPYWDYLSFEFKLAQSFDQDLYGLVKVLLNEILVSLDIINSILKDEFMPQSQNVLSNVDNSLTGEHSIRLETSKGPALYAIDCGENLMVNGFGFNAPSLTNLYSLETRLKGVPVDHIARIIYAYNITDLSLMKS